MWLGSSFTQRQKNKRALQNRSPSTSDWICFLERIRQASNQRGLCCIPPAFNSKGRTSEFVTRRPASEGSSLNFQSHKRDLISRRFYHKSSLMWCSILEESLSRYGRVRSFIKTIIFALFVMTCKKQKQKQNNKKKGITKSVWYTVSLYFAIVPKVA